MYVENTLSGAEEQRGTSGSQNPYWGVRNPTGSVFPPPIWCYLHAPCYLPRLQAHPINPNIGKQTG